jgi:hypothetical protein
MVPNDESRNTDLIWPIWSVPLDLDSIESVLTHHHSWLNPEDRQVIGIDMVFCALRHSTDNGSHFFSPARAI